MNAIAKYTGIQKVVALILLFSVLTTTFLTTEMFFDSSIGINAKAEIDGVIVSFDDVPTKLYEVDAGTTLKDIGLPKLVKTTVEKDSLKKTVYIDAVWECNTFSEKTELNSEYTFKLSESSLPCSVKEGVELPTLKVKSGKYCIKGFEAIDPKLVAQAVNPNEEAVFPETVEAYIGNDVGTTSVKVNWVSNSETVKGGTKKKFTNSGSKYYFRAEAAETDKYYFTSELSEVNLKAYSAPYITVYAISSTVAYVGAGGLSNLTAAYNYINTTGGGSGTIIINDHYSYYESEANHDPNFSIVKKTGDNYSDSFFHEPKHSGMVVIKGNNPNAVLQFSYRFYLAGDVMFKDITLRARSSMKERIYGNGHDLVMGTGITCGWDAETTAGYVQSYSNALRIYGGSATTDLNGNTRVLLLSGEYYLVRGGNEEGGTIYGNTHVHLGGTAKTYYALQGGSRKGVVQGSTYVMISGDAEANALSGGEAEATNTAVYGGGTDCTINGDKDKNGVVEGGSHVIAFGGTINAAVSGSNHEGTNNGKVFVVITGSTVINSGTQGAIYGVGAGSASSTIAKNDVFIAVCGNARLLAKSGVFANIYGTNVSDNVNANITIDIHGNAYIEGSVNGGAYAANSGIGTSNSHKNTSVTIRENAYIKNSVYGGSLRKGVYGNCSVTVKDNATVGLVVYGGGQGASSVSEANEYGMALNTSLLIEGNVKVNNVFGGGNYGYVKGTSSIVVRNATIGGSVHGGGDFGGVGSKSTVTIIGSVVENNVYGGNGSSAIIYWGGADTEVNILDGSLVKGSVFGGSWDTLTKNTSVNIKNARVNGSVLGGGEKRSSGDTTVTISENTIISGNVHGAGHDGDVGKAQININSGFVNNIYGGGYSGFASGVEINVSGVENSFNFDIKGKITGFPENPGDDSRIASKVNSSNSYVLKFNNFFGEAGKNIDGCGDVKSISHFSNVDVANSHLTFTEEKGEIFTGITVLNLSTQTTKVELPKKSTIMSDFNASGNYSVSGTNVLPATFNGVEGSVLAIPARAETDEEELASKGKVSPIFTIYGKATGDTTILVDGEKKSGTYVTSFISGSKVGNDIDNATLDYFYENRNGKRTGHNRNFAKYMADTFKTGAIIMDGVAEVHASDRVFTTLINGAYGMLDSQNSANWVIWEGKPYAGISISKVGETEIDGDKAPLGGVEFTVYEDEACNVAIESVVTNEKGIALTGDLSADNVTYYIKETKTGKDYTLDETVYSVTLTNGDSGNIVALTDDAIVNYLKYGEIIIIKKSDDGVLLEGVSFLIKGEGYEKTLTTNAVGYISTGKIPYGEYTITEVSNANPGFVAPDFKETVTVGDNTPLVSIDVTNNRVTGKVVLTKKNENDEPLAGVSFDIYADASKNVLVDTIITDSNGYAESKELTIYGSETKYYVVETITLEGYVLNTKVYEAILTPDATIATVADPNSDVVYNYFEKATIAISKKGENDALLEGVVFGIYSDAECQNLVERIITDNTGSAVSTNLKLGTYYVKEISNPDKTYLVSDTVYTFVLDENNKVYTETVYNIKAGAYISLEKIDSDGKAMAGVEFEIRNANGGVVAVITTDENGKAISSALTIAVGEENLFTVKEIKAPDYVYINETVFEAVLTNDNEIYEINGGEPIVNKIKEGYLTLEKQDETGKPLAGVEFTVYTDSACTNAVDKIVTDENGKGESGKLPFGTYYVKETKNPDAAYVLVYDVFVAVISEETGTVANDKLYVPVSSAPIVNFHASGCIAISKVDEEGKPLAGVEFTIYDENMRELSKVYTGADGKVVTCNQVIRDGVNGTKYYVVETNVSDEYKLDNTRYEAILKTNGQVYALNAGEAIVNYFKRGTISLNKQSEDGKPLAGVEFTVYTDSACTNAVDKIVTGADGKGVSTALKLGTYYVKETKNPDSSFVLTPDVWSITLTEDGKTAELTAKPIVNFHASGCIAISKVDEEGKPLEGVEFTIYDENMRELSKVYTGADGKVVTCNQVIRDGVNGTKYYVVETNVSDEYKLDNTRYEAILKTNGQVYALNAGEAIVNYFKRGTISLNKQSEDGKPLSGVEFTVYTDSACTNAVDKIVTGADGKGVSTALKLGTYYVKETKNPDSSFVLTPDVWSITLTEDGKTAELTAKPIVNFHASGCIAISKVDEEGKPLAGVEFTIYDENMRELSKVYTGADGKVVTCNQVIRDGVNGTKYYVVETNVSAEYKLDNTRYEAILKTNGQVYALNAGEAIVNYFKRGTISLTKQSEDGKPLAGVEFTVYTDSACTNAVDKIVTGADGKGESKALKLGTYYVKETNTVAPFVPVSNVWSVTLTEDNKAVELTSTPIVNYYSTGKITLVKTDDKGNLLKGVEFTIYTLDGGVVGTIVTDENGVATSNLLPVKNAEGTVYKVKETKGLEGYEINTEEYSVILKNNSETVSVNGGKPIINKQLTGKVTVTYKSENDPEDQEVQIVVKVNGELYNGEYIKGGVVGTASNGIINVRTGDSFQINLAYGDTYTVDALEETLNYLVKVTYNGEEAENCSGSAVDGSLETTVDIVAVFEVPAKPGDASSIVFFAVLSAISAFALIVLEAKKRRYAR